MTEPTAADREWAARVMPDVLYGSGEQAHDAIAYAIAAAREEGRNEIRAKVEALADDWEHDSGLADRRGVWIAAGLRAAVAPAQPRARLTRQPPPPPNPLLAATIDDNPARPLA